jgi:hypothetical protein
MFRNGRRRRPVFGSATRRATLLGLFAAVLLALPAAANATHDGTPYWFWRGYLPTTGGVITKHKDGGCCTNWIVTRMSWEVGTHDMKFIFITWGGAWHGFWANTGPQGCCVTWDDDAVVDQGTYRRGGCQNPPEVNWWAVWTNCHTRNTLAG